MFGIHRRSAGEDVLDGARRKTLRAVTLERVAKLARLEQTFSLSTWLKRDARVMCGCVAIIYSAYVCGVDAKRVHHFVEFEVFGVSCDDGRGDVKWIPGANR